MRCMNLLKHFRVALKAMQILAPGEKVIVGVSGGADSLALMHLFVQVRDEMGIVPHVVHVHHGIRGKEADEDAVFVEQIAQAWAVPYTIQHVDVLALVKQQRLSLEEAARKARYSILAQAATNVGTQLIAVAHNADDQAETVLMHLLRGSGLAGLRGILPIVSLDGQSTIVRPLLDVPHSSLEEYCAANQITPRQDSSNADPAYFRNRLRHQIMPLLNELVPGLRERLGQSANLLSADHQLVWLRVLQGWNETVLEEGQQRVRFRRKAWLLQPLAVQRELIRWVVQRLRGSLNDLSYENVEAGVQLAKNSETGAQVNLPNGLVIRLGYDEVIISEELAAVPIPDQPLLTPGQVINVTQPDVYHTLLDGWRFIWSDYNGPRVGSDWDGLMADSFREVLSRDALTASPEFLLRTRRPGDRFYPQGAGGSQSLKKFMNAAKIPAPWRDSLPILTRGADVIWVCGYRVDERFIVRPETHKVWLARFEKTR
jgi:tRNA(Ile)-lysidine synthase